MGELVAFPDDRGRAVELVRAAVAARGIPGEDPAEVRAFVEEVVRTPAAPGRLYRVDGTDLGIVLWHPATPLGVGIALAHLERPAADAEGYRDLLERCRALLGPVPFLPGGLAGLTPREEDALLASFGYAPFGRLEMRRALDGEVDAVPAPAGAVVRTPRPNDEPALARLHAAAYFGQFDRYLFYADPDPARDAEIQLREVFSGVHGDFLPEASAVVDRDGRLDGACLVVRRPYGPLIVDVMVDPAARGHGVGRAVVLGALDRLGRLGERVAVLNVTVGNDPALGLYRSLGFRATIGPSREWFDRSLIPTRPGAGYEPSAASRDSAPRSVE